MNVIVDNDKPALPDLCSLIAGKWDSRRSHLSGSTFLPVSRFSSRSTMKAASSCCQTSWVRRCISGSCPNRGHGITTSFVPAGTSFRRWRSWSWGRRPSRLRLPRRSGYTLPMLQEKAGRRIAVDRSREDIPLPQHAANSAELLHLFFGFDPLSHSRRPFEFR
jgi:hypothetical protein